MGEPYVPQGAHQRFLIEAWLFLRKNFLSSPLVKSSNVPASHSRTRGHTLSILLHQFARLTHHGVKVTVQLDLTHPLDQWVKLPSGLPVLVIAGMFRRPFAQALAAGRYDWYLYTENDVLVTPHNLLTLCEESVWIAPGHASGLAEQPSTCRAF